VASVFPASAEDNGRVYVYAQRLTEARSWMPVYCDGEPVARIKAGRLFAIHLAAGRHTLSLEPGVPLPIEVRPGEESFVRLDWHMELGRSAIPVFNLTRPELARKEMTNLSYIDPKQALSPAVAKTDVRELRQPELRRR
jgi:hypothetical protein